MKKLLPLFLVLASCTPLKDQWVLQSYDEQRGYVFSRNGVKYEASCFATGIPVVGPDHHPDPDLDSLPPNPASSQAECSDILPYLHQPVPGLREIHGSILLFKGKNNQKLEFIIRHTK